MTKKPTTPDNDDELFSQMMGEVRPITQDKISPYRPKPPARPLNHPEDEKPLIQDMMSDPLVLDEVGSNDELLFVRPGVQPKLMRKLRRGQCSIEAELDLHRMTADEARQAIAQFLPQMSQSGTRYVRIIHGKGHGSFNNTPVLKNKLNHWLRQRDEVLAFCSAQPVDGGSGALYAILKRQR